AVSDPTGTIARPLCVVERVGTDDGLARLRALIVEEGPDRVVVGLPLTLRGERGEQARETELFVETLRRTVEAPVELFDERFTSAGYLTATASSKWPGLYAGGGKRRSLEGFLFPAEYAFFSNETARRFVVRQLTAFRHAFAHVDLSYARSKNLTRYDVLIIA